MLEIFLNPITISVIVLCGLCLFKVNVIIAILVSAMLAGLMAGMNVSEIMNIILAGLADNGETTLAYLLLGIFASALAYVGLTDRLGGAVSKLVKGSRIGLPVALMVCGAISGTIVPVHIAFIPILVPPLLSTMNKLRIDRRQVACALTFGLLAMYPSIPLGYGTIFHGIIADNMTKNGIPMATSEVWHYTLILFLGMVVAFVSSMWYFRKPRDYKELEIPGANDSAKANTHSGTGREMWVSLISIAVLLGVQLYTGSMPLGALAGLLTMLVGGAIKLRDCDAVVDEGIRIMGMISFIMLVAGGYATVVRESGAVDTLVNAALDVVGSSKPMFIIVLILIGLTIDMGIGTSFGTVPIISIIYVPMCLRIGMSPAATCCLIACAAVMGDAGSPASDTTLGPTAGLNADGQHDHILDTCVPSFLFYNIPLGIAGFVGAMIL